MEVWYTIVHYVWVLFRNKFSILHYLSTYLIIVNVLSAPTQQYLGILYSVLVIDCPSGLSKSFQYNLLEWDANLGMEQRNGKQN